MSEIERSDTMIIEEYINNLNDFRELEEEDMNDVQKEIDALKETIKTKRDKLLAVADEGRMEEVEDIAEEVVEDEEELEENITVKEVYENAVRTISRGVRFLERMLRRVKAAEARLNRRHIILKNFKRVEDLMERVTKMTLKERKETYQDLITISKTGEELNKQMKVMSQSLKTLTKGDERKERLSEKAGKLVEQVIDLKRTQGVLSPKALEEMIKSYEKKGETEKVDELKEELKKMCGYE